MNEIIGEQIERTIMSLYLKITVPPWAAPCLRLQARGTARARPVKVSNSEGTPRHAQGSLTIGTCDWACLGVPVPGRARASARIRHAQVNHWMSTVQLSKQSNEVSRKV